MSSRVLIISGVIVLILIIGVAAFMMMKPGSSNQQAEVTPQVEESNPSPASAKGTIQSLLTAGRTVTCEVRSSDQTQSSTIYVSGTKFRGDFIVKSETHETVSHMIQLDGFGYFWTEGSEQGTKIDLAAAKNLVQATQSGKTATQPQSPDLNKEQDMKCSTWTVDNSKFTVPTDVQFTDLSQIMKQIPAKTGATPKVDPSVCNQISDPAAKAACLKSLSGQ